MSAGEPRSLWIRPDLPGLCTLYTLCSAIILDRAHAVRAAGDALGQVAIDASH